MVRLPNMDGTLGDDSSWGSGSIGSGVTGYYGSGVGDGSALGSPTGLSAEDLAYGAGVVLFPPLMDLGVLYPDSQAGQFANAANSQFLDASGATRIGGNVANEVNSAARVAGNVADGVASPWTLAPLLIGGAVIVFILMDEKKK